MIARIASIVEGHGEVEALPTLLGRLGLELDPPVRVLGPRPQRLKRASILHRDGAQFLDRHLQLARDKVGAGGGLIVLLDADDDCAAEVGPTLTEILETAYVGMPYVAALAVREYEGWLLGAAESLAGACGLPQSLKGPPEPEGIRDAKGWLTHCMPGSLAYGAVRDQEPLTRAFDIEAAARACPSFARFRRKVHELLVEVAR